jgi:hypothetical protein
MISCEKASLICNKSQYRDASLWEKISLRFHLLMCKTCAQFTKKNTKFTELCNQANLEGLLEKEKAQMKKQLQDSQK